MGYLLQDDFLDAPAEEGVKEVSGAAAESGVTEELDDDWGEEES